MKIYLYLQDKILNFSIPEKVTGSYSFDEFPEEEAKLINIEARNDSWYLYSTSDVFVLDGNTKVESIPLKIDSYYILKRDNINYLIYVTYSLDRRFISYLYKQDLNLVIGNSSDCNINFTCGFINGVAARIFFNATGLSLEVTNNMVYLNSIALRPKTTYNIHSGDTINIYGLKIVFLNGFLLINNPLNAVKLNNSTNLTNYHLANIDNPTDFEFKDKPLYTKDEYFSKSPRVRRTITTKVLKLSAPPKTSGNKEMPMILTIGPMLTMGMVSGVMVANTIAKIAIKETTLAKSWPTLISSGAMMLSMILWPILTRIFNKKYQERQKKLAIKRYTEYLHTKGKELQEEAKIQRDILIENLISVEECLKIINNAKINFWDKRLEQNDFLHIRIGRGNELLDAKVEYPEEGFTIEEDELRKRADSMIADLKYINDVPLKYSLYDSYITAIMGEKEKGYGMINNIILQLITFYSYEDIKIVLFTNKLNEDKWEYIKYLNHSFSNDKSIRFFASDYINTKNLADYLNYELQNRLANSSNSNQNKENKENNTKLYKPYYIIITDDYSMIKSHNFTKNLTEADTNIGFSLLILESRMSKLPSKCNNFITLGVNSSGILKNSFDAQEQIKFYDEINNNIDMMAVARKLSNIPIEFEEGHKELPDSITFLEMEKVGKIEQLNILNRWNTNDSTTSLKAEVGVDEEGNIMYLDLHEKFHGPHGLIAGMTGSGKSEFIITYILSMAINYSPDDVAFILIDYKGGGLAFAFENKATGMYLPHLTGTITNLDKAEMDRTLVSVDSEIKRRQKVFNNARNKLGESTMDIYKYQKFYKEGKLNEPIPHLFIICDEFAELKSGQPEFMDNLISVARIGRSLGVHLILATQKPSGVVNDQIWSNSKFRVCLKVQNESDSKEMLKRPEAASIKQTGRFYLQVGYDEYFALGQSAWCGAKYYPSEKIVKQVDKSVNFINDTGSVIKSVQAGKSINIAPQGEQLSAILQNIIEVAKMTGKKAKRLWLNDIDATILVDTLAEKYNFQFAPYDISAIIGEYDAPERQEQGLLTYSLKDAGNTVIFGNDEVEKENLLNTIIYSICKNHSAKEINIYILDFGSEQIRMFNNFPQIGGMVFTGDDEAFTNAFKLINEEIKTRKKLLIPYGGSFENYNNQNTEKLPQILFVINNYEGMTETYNDIYEEISSIGRECVRYGITLLTTCNTTSSLTRKVSLCFDNRYALHLNDPSDYYSIFNEKYKTPRNTFGRGITNKDGIHEFQTASIVPAGESLTEFLNNTATNIKNNDKAVAKPIPTLPEKVTLDLIEPEITDFTKVPIGISKNTLKSIKYDFESYKTTNVTANKINTLASFTDSLLDIFLRIQDLNIIFIDCVNLLPTANKELNGKKVNYFNNNFDEVLDKLTELETNNNNRYKMVYIIYSIERLKLKANSTKIDNLFKAITKNENSHIIICDHAKGLKSVEFESWYAPIKNNTDGIWIGRGFGEQSVFRVSRITKEMMENRPSNYGYYVTEGNAELMKVLEFNNLLNTGDDDNE